MPVKEDGPWFVPMITSEVTNACGGHMFYILFPMSELSLSPSPAKNRIQLMKRGTPWRRRFMGLAWAVDEASSVRAIEGAASMMTVRVLRSEAGLVGRDVGDGVGCP